MRPPGTQAYLGADWPLHCREVTLDDLQEGVRTADAASAGLTQRSGRSPESRAGSPAAAELPRCAEAQTGSRGENAGGFWRKWSPLASSHPAPPALYQSSSSGRLSVTVRSRQPGRPCRESPSWAPDPETVRPIALVSGRGVSGRCVTQ